jgi:hypothetical protein
MWYWLQYTAARLQSTQYQRLSHGQRVALLLGLICATLAVVLLATVWRLASA